MWYVKDKSRLFMELAVALWHRRRTWFEGYHWLVMDF